MVLSYSPVETVTFEGQTLYLKRDDLLHPDFSGNKARKFHYFLTNDFSHIKKVISYGSTQSNAMYSLSVLAKMKGWDFEYIVDHISSYLKENLHGNLKGALGNGMKLSIGDSLLKEEQDSTTLFIEEGGKEKEALYGISILAEEILSWKKENSIEELNIFLPSGTGTTALFLQKSFLEDIKDSTIEVFTTPCVGDSCYLKKQFLELEKDECLHPTILKAEKKHHFGKLYRENYIIWLKLQEEMGVEFDLLYDPLGWRVLLNHKDLFLKPTLYIHQGGLLGNESMLPRYERKYKDIYEDNL